MASRAPAAPAPSGKAAGPPAAAPAPPNSSEKQARAGRAGGASKKEAPLPFGSAAPPLFDEKPLEAEGPRAEAGTEAGAEEPWAEAGAEAGADEPWAEAGADEPWADEPWAEEPWAEAEAEAEAGRPKKAAACSKNPPAGAALIRRTPPKKALGGPAAGSKHTAAPPPGASKPPGANGRGAHSKNLPEKRGPGRPPNKPPPEPVPRRGVVAAPGDPANRLELVHDAPQFLKPLFSCYKNNKTREIHVRCAPDGLTFFARDHSRTQRIVAELRGSRLCEYFCEGTMWLFLMRSEQLASAFTSADKSIQRFGLCVRYDDPGRMCISLYDGSAQITRCTTLDLSTLEPDPELYEAQRLLADEALFGGAFPLSFVLAKELLKKTFADAAMRRCDTVDVEKHGAFPLQIKYVKPTFAYEETYQDPEAIQLRSSLGPDDTFRARISTATARSFANSLVSDRIQIFCQEVGVFLYRTVVDEASALIISTLIGTA